MDVAEIQFLLDSGNSMTRVASDLGIHHQTLRRFIDRNNLEAYIAFDEVSQRIPTHDVEKCIFIDESFKVSFNEDRLNELSTICGRSIGELKSSVRYYTNSLELDALDMFVRSFDFDELNNEAITRHRHIVNYIYRHCGSFDAFREMFGISSELVKYSSDRLRSWYIHEGLKFERLLSDSLTSNSEVNISTNTYSDGCMPDFIINSRWFDAKLSKSTALSPADDTIPKYLEHTDHLTIIYAFDDGADTSEVEELYNVDFVHVSEYYGLMSAEAVTEFEELIERVGVLKGRSI